MVTQQTQRDDLRRRYHAAVNAPMKRREEKEALYRRFLVAERGPVSNKPQTIDDLRRGFGDERTDPGLWDTLPEPLQRHWAILKAGAGETLTELERRSASAPAPVEYACLRRKR